MRNERLEKALRAASEMFSGKERIAGGSTFTHDTAVAADKKKYEGVQKKPETATIRVEQDVVNLVKTLPRSDRVRIASEAIRNAIISKNT